jgi:hypothetical protein
MGRKAMSETTNRPHPFSRFEAHPFEGSDGARTCGFCGEHLASILHHPTRIRAACLLHGIDPASLRRRPPRPAAA